MSTEQRKSYTVKVFSDATVNPMTLIQTSAVTFDEFINDMQKSGVPYDPRLNEAMEGKTNSLLIPETKMAQEDTLIVISVKDSKAGGKKKNRDRNLIMADYNKLVSQFGVKARDFIAQGKSPTRISSQLLDERMVEFKKRIGSPQSAADVEPEPVVEPVVSKETKIAKEAEIIKKYVEKLPPLTEDPPKQKSMEELCREVYDMGDPEFKEEFAALCYDFDIDLCIEDADEIKAKQMLTMMKRWRS